MRWIAAITLVCLVLANPARAAPVDLSRFSCDDWLDAGQDEQEQMVAWLRGYLAGRSTSTMFNVATLRNDTTALKLFCQSHHDIGLTSAASQWRN